MTLEEVQDLLASPELAEIRPRLPPRFVTESSRSRPPPRTSASSTGRSFPGPAFSSSSRPAAHELVRLGTSLLAASAGGQDDEEAYPAGEEAAPEPPNAQMIGLQNGLALTYACYLHLLDRPPDELTGFLKWRRIRGAARFAGQLRKYARP